MSSSSARSEISPTVVTGLLRVGDLATIALAAVIAHYVRFGNVDLRGDYALAILLVVLLTANVFQLADLYAFSRLTSHLFQTRRLFLVWSLVSLMVVAAAFLTKTSTLYSRLWVGLWFIFAFTGLAVLRFSVKLALVRWQRQGRLSRKVAVVGAGEQGQRIVRFLLTHPDAGLELVGVFDDRKSRVPTDIEGYPVLGTVDDLLAAVRAGRVDFVIVALPWSAENRLLDLFYKLKTAPIDVRLCPEGVAFHFANRPFQEMRGLNMLSIFERPLSNWNRVVKNMEDRFLAALFLLFTAPLLLTIAALIKLDDGGPVLFRQKRYGFNNKVINVYKFRTMRQNAEDDSDVPQATRNDPRVTRLGAFLRRTSLDELPQFFNVLRGEMSIVGPRPHAVAHNKQFAVVVDEYLARHNVKPGITGWAQINGFRGEIKTREDLENRVRYDLYYIDHWSLTFDLRIMVLTALRGFIHEKAY